MHDRGSELVLAVKASHSKAEVDTGLRRAGRQDNGFAGSDKSIRDVPYGFIGRKAPFSKD